ncbi:MAG: EamA family transporter [Rudaea sp.]
MTDLGAHLSTHRALGFAALCVVIVGSATGNLLLKIGAEPRPPGSLIFGLVAWQTIAGIASFGCGVIAYAWALKQFELHVAQIVISLQYVLAILLASTVLGEHISLTQWSGIALIAAGLFVCMQ